MSVYKKSGKKEQLIAVAYYRFSSHKQNEQSIEGQRHDCERYARDHGIKIVHEYIDRATSATSDNRPNFKKLIEDSSSGSFNTVIVWKLDRFARNRYDSSMYKAILKRNGVKVISAMEPIPDSPEGVLLESMLEGMAEYFSLDLAQKMRRGARESAKKLKMLGGTPPLGYKRDSEGHYQIDETNAEKVRLIYKLYINGSTNAEIIQYLNSHGITNAKGKPFVTNGIYSILGNIRYTGTYKYDDIIIPDSIPAIIDKETYERAQRMKNKNRTTLRRQLEQRKYPLSTKLFCGCCGRMMIGYCGTGRSGNRYYYYICPNHRQSKKNCTTKNISAEYLEETVYQALREMVMTDEVIDKIAIRIDDSNRQARENSLLISLQKQRTEVDKGIENITRAIETGLISPTLTKRLQELEDQKLNLDYSIADEKAKAPALSLEQIKFLLKQLREEREAAEYNEQLVDSLVHRIYLYEDKIIIWLNYTKEPTSEETKELESLILENSSTVLHGGSPEPLKHCV